MTEFAPVAVVGLGGLFPQAPDLDTFQRHIRTRHDASRPAPPGRWVLDPNDAHRPDPAPDTVYSTRACFIDDFVFDPAGLNLDRNTLRGLDPLYEMVLHVGRQAFADIATGPVDRDRVGVTLAAIALPTDGASTITSAILGRAFEHVLFGTRPRPAPPSSPLNARVTARPASLLAQALGLGGGSCTLDAACASSLVAIKLACDELQAGRTDAMLAGGVSRPESLYTQMGFSQLRALAPSGVCRPFGADADGLVVGEGAGIVVLKRLDDARRDGDIIYGVIRGIGLSNDVSGSLLAANADGQLRAMRAAYTQAGWAPSDVDLIECHGTGTPLGDAVELESLHRLWRESPAGTVWSPGQCAIGSVKSNIGHLLTAAGAAGLVKTLLALRDRELPPSANVDPTRVTPALAAWAHQSAQDRGPIESPFRLQTQTQPWARRDDRTPRRAAVSGFGFGGINAHLLLEEADAPRPWAAPARVQTSPRPHLPSVPIAIVGMDAHLGRLNSLRAFQEATFKGHSAIAPWPTTRWWGRDELARAAWGAQPPPGAYLDGTSVEVGAFRMPPSEIPETLPQQLLMLQSVARALEDTRTPTPRGDLRTGVIIGMGLDFNTTNFHHRWALLNLARQWARMLDLQLDQQTFDDWVATLRDESGPALTPGRVLGSLGNIIASRIAREFAFGGASFAISAEEASGVRALDVGLSALRRGELDRVVVGAVDLPGDVRAMVTTHAVRPYSRRGEVRPFDSRADGTVVGEGAVTLVLKRLPDAIAAGDRVYAAIRGLGIAGGDSVEPHVDTYTRALERAYADAAVDPKRVGYLEAHGSGEPGEDAVETAALTAFFAAHHPPGATAVCAIGSAKPTVGHVGAASGLTSVVKAALCIYQELVPPLSGFLQPMTPEAWRDGPFYMPVRPEAWLHDRALGPRCAGVSVMTCDGGSAHVVLEEVPQRHTAEVHDRRQPLGSRDQALFGVSGANIETLRSGLATLGRLVNHGSESPDIDDIESLARRWHATSPTSIHADTLGMALHATSRGDLQRALDAADRSLRLAPERTLRGQNGVFFSPNPLRGQGEVAFVFPGSGAHYVGMGVGVATQWPDIVRKLGEETAHLRGQHSPELLTPRRHEWRDGWRRVAEDALSRDFLAMLQGQVAHGVVMSDLLRALGLQPSAAIGYSLGESTALFAMRAWTDRDEMYDRLRRSPLFQHELVGRCDAARAAWNLHRDESVDWRSVVINRPAEVVREAIAGIDRAYLQIVNTHDECVIGGQASAVEAVISALRCESVDLGDASTVHCAVAASVSEAYRQLHRLPTTPIPGIRFYSAALTSSYPVDEASAAEAIVAQAVTTVDFAATIERAYADGVRVFVEAGPQGSCSRMIGKILDGRPHLAQSACLRDEEDVTTVLRLMGALYANRAITDFGALYTVPTPPSDVLAASARRAAAQIVVPTGVRAPQPRLPARQADRPAIGDLPDVPQMLSHTDVDAPAGFGVDSGGTAVARQHLADVVAQTAAAGAAAHNAFLRYSQTAMRGLGEALALEARLLGVLGGPPVSAARVGAVPEPAVVAYDRDQCLEFAIGSAEAVLGPAFADLDRFPVRVRLPDEPLMLVDRILRVDGVKGSMGGGRVITEHDVHRDAWYLDGGRTPVCITVEAGQADLFLCSYLGIDLEVRGTRSYRLLDATVTFHRGLPQPGDRMRYDIYIDRFVRQGDTYLFFFRFEGTLNGQTVLTMEHGCAGFFTEQETAASGGILLFANDQTMTAGQRPDDWQDIVPMAAESFDAPQLEALRQGDLASCFGPQFLGLDLDPALRLPTGRMRLIDRVVHLDPAGGRYGLGLIQAEADIRPDAWFLTCHFVDDMVMPGTLMYECCLHTLRVFLMRMGWVTNERGVSWEPVPGAASALRCRGPVTQATQRVRYEVHIKEVGYRPDPYALADALIYADGHRIVQFTNMSLQLTGATREQVETAWRRARAAGGSRHSATDLAVSAIGDEPIPLTRRHAIYDNDRILAFAVGKPSDAFGEPYRVFDADRRIARLPGPPFKFLDRITATHADAWTLAPGGWIEAQYDIPPDAWYFRANRQPAMPFAILLEVALQPCGWLAAYLGSALRSREDLSFRNLGGTATLHEEVFGHSGTLTVRVRITRISEAGGMIVQSFDLQVWRSGQLVYSGDTQFGFFSAAALAQQIGIRDASDRRYRPGPDEILRARPIALQTLAPVTPTDANTAPADGTAALPARALLMIDAVELFVPDGGPAGLGFIRGVKAVDPDEWFFAAHFYQDPVCPGSLGLESFLQLLKLVALDRWGEQVRHTHRFEPMTLGQTHAWIYRGQIIPRNRRVEVDLVVTGVQEGPTPALSGHGFLSVDGIPIYEVRDFGIRLVV
ncbi:MAG: beta-ketoacyl synthase N-terminal-like domain-containing protein [Acidobacteria bacterium]|nr:beta-ketoacyl synthase N-terminal-like domain-containing protein [Acidobacteriota bacterium]